MNYISVAQETKKIIRNREYEINGKTIKLPELDYEEVDVISPQLGEELLAAHAHHYKSVVLGAWGCGAFRKIFHRILSKEN